MNFFNGTKDNFKKPAVDCVLPDTILASEKARIRISFASFSSFTGSFAAIRNSEFCHTISFNSKQEIARH